MVECERVAGGSVGGWQVGVDMVECERVAGGRWLW